ncbi:VOC family protein [Novosphingobium sp.]|uniref:VOC family protein n=1 Tax=Novosphingobium sp. TaxID=1874826 RepID=UPI001EBE255A|nr:VOC family protein [Novosphingobium sp.]MBK6802328.1 VOC family protein [Novosphingobium sp.]MBK9009614.1 VOC family protein [Novosphingobium sp.]
MSVKSLGYVVIEATRPAEWDRFLTRVAGAMRAPDAADGAALYRVDERSFRFRIEGGAADRLVAPGYEVESAAAYEALAAKIAAAGREVLRASAGEAAARGVSAFFRTSDPAGNGLEFYHGDSRSDAPFVSPAGVSRFVTGDLGMGHAVLCAPNFAETVAFYCDVVGFGQTDMPRFYFNGGPPEDPGMGFAFLHASNGRHHSLALGEGPVPPSGCVHLMLEMPDLIEVGKAHDRMRAEGFPESATLGRHVNDEMTSFYVQTPAGFDLEIGCDGLVIDPASWETTRHEAISVWGHVWAWQEAMKKAAQ